MTTQLRFVLVSLLLGSAAFVRAEPTPPSARSATRTPVPVLAVLDADRDGVLSQAEIAASPGALTALDLNDDGLVSPDELRAPASVAGRPVRTVGVSSGLTVVLTLDANHDGDIQPMEIANAVSSLKRLDLNGDGLLTREELRPTATRRVAAL